MQPAGAAPLDSVAPPASIHWPSLGQLVFSGMAVIGLWGGGISLLLVGLASRVTPAAGAGGEVSLLLVAAGLFFSGCLVLPSAWFALRRLLGRVPSAAPRWPAALRPTLLIFIFPLVLALGTWVIRATDLAWLLLPPLHLLAVSIPVAWLLAVTRRGLPGGSPQRIWGVFVSGLVLAPGVAVVGELFAMLALLLLLAFGLSASPQWQSEITFLAQRYYVQQLDPQQLLEMVSPYLANPVLLYLGLTLFSVLVPLIEEAAKPLGLWLLAGRDLTPAQGFGLGALSGAGFALYENLMLSSGGPDWTVLVAARVGTAVVHIFTSACSGWALAHAFRRSGSQGLRPYLRLGLVYLGVVLVHGLWNGLTILSAYNGLLAEAGHPAPAIITALEPVTVYALSAGSVILLAALLWANARLSRLPAVAPIPDLPGVMDPDGTD